MELNISLALCFTTFQEVLSRKNGQKIFFYIKDFIKRQDKVRKFILLIKLMV